jgi:hypothetical protein
VDLATCQRHKEIAETARKRLSQLEIKSTNKFWQNSRRVYRGVVTQRYLLGLLDIQGTDLGLEKGAWAELKDDEFVSDMTFTLRAGNCDEKASVFGTLASRDRRSTGSHIYRCAFRPYDHTIAILTVLDDLVIGTTDLTLRDFGPDALVLDGWAEDWWFPNVGKFDTLRYDLWRAGTPFALKVRGSSKKCNNLTIRSKIC